MTLPNGKRVDVAGFDENRDIIFVEVKASDNDFQNDKKWKDYLLYCDKFYFFGDWEFLPHIKDDKTGAGFLLKYGNTIEVCCETAIEHSAKNRVFEHDDRQKSFHSIYIDQRSLNLILVALQYN
ncbi:MmcB family DNA repair protein [Bacillus thuringiensis]|uniref:MmcB family DNA repair protein n=1 Tax=Bacillus thuringiensis TaxID=1428 RepID=UPI001F58D2A2